MLKSVVISIELCFVGVGACLVRYHVLLAQRGASVALAVCGTMLHFYVYTPHLAIHATNYGRHVYHKLHTGSLSYMYNTESRMYAGE